MFTDLFNSDLRSSEGFKSEQWIGQEKKFAGSAEGCKDFWVDYIFIAICFSVILKYL